ncbi:hypothetical protein TanjilG_08511 [Lupinus angustifolius]|uniref:Protein LHY n=1 Tax=Lupinus angustifolius TaxID=3871 RepID=A0A1J7GPL6_LUPAN|nr:hypothetical protein TanjilG_08511 [Lupinus angustifolius]
MIFVKLFLLGLRVLLHFCFQLEKEALVKGSPIGQALDIDIPPPRPKRKPSNPYPRKTNVGAPTYQGGAKDRKLISVESSHVKQTLDFEKVPLPEKYNDGERQTHVKDNKDENCSKVFPVLQEAPCSSVSSGNKSSISMSAPLRNSCTLREIISSMKEAISQDEINESLVTIEPENRKLEVDDGKQINGTRTESQLENCDASQVKLVQSEKTDGLNCTLTIDGMQGNQSYPKHVTVHVVNGNLGTSTQNPSLDMLFRDSMFQPIGKVNGQPNLFTNSAASNISENQNNTAPSSIHQPDIPYPPFAQHNRHDCQPFLHLSTTFSNLTVSTLLQNPAAHAATSFAAAFLPYENAETSANSPACFQGSFPSRQIGSSPNVEAIAAATVAAATAWWAAHGLLPVCAPLYTAFVCPTASMTAVPLMNIDEAPAPNTELEESTLQNPPSQDQMLDPEHPEAQHSASKPSTVISSDSKENGDGSLNTSLKATTDHEMNTTISENFDSDKTKSRKQVDRSSCGSNTTSSSDVETDALEKNGKGNEQPVAPEPDANHLITESSNRRSRSIVNLIDPWKEVSEEGRLAFRALFSREVLPQSFSLHDLKNKDHQMDNIKDNNQNVDDKYEDLNSKKCCSDCEGMQKNLPFLENEERLLTMGLGQGNLKTRPTGFIPYKRCSVEAKENNVGTSNNQAEEKGSKRIRLEGEASI